jgi:hypothetical protein
MIIETLSDSIICLEVIINEVIIDDREALSMITKD